MTFDLHNFAERYTAAWCSRDAARVASFFAPNGSLTITNGAPSVGHIAIATAAQEFMTAFPDLQVIMDDVSGDEAHAIYRWTLDGTNDGPGGSGAHVRVSGYEEWQIGSDGLIAKSLGHFDPADYERQINSD